MPLSSYGNRVNIKRPTLLLDEAKCHKNIETMADKARKKSLHFRPHFKTHQSLEIGRWFRNSGVRSITTSSLSMASYFAQDGWDDITVAFPLNVREMDAVNELASRISLTVLVESSETLSALNSSLRNRCNVNLKIDSGFGRTGIPSSCVDEVTRLTEEISRSPMLNLTGLLTHAGHSYKARSKAEILRTHEDSLNKMKKLKSRLRALTTVKISVGDTPSCSVAEDFPGVDEIRPGNFVFYDMMQHQISSCDVDQIAVAVACPVVARHPERNELIVYGGAIHFSKDFILDDEGKRVFGAVVDLDDEGWSPPVKNAFVSSLSQEHGIVSAPADYINRMHVGDLIGVLPVHSCLTAECMGEYRTLTGRTIDHF